MFHFPFKMVDIHIKELSCLILEEIKKHLPTNYKITTLEKEDFGRQKKETLVVGEFYEVQRRKTQFPGSQQAVRLKLKGVLPNNSIGLRFEVVIFGKTVDIIEEALKSIGNSTLWIAFSNILVVKYTGQEEPWCPFGLKVVDQEENDTNLKQEITLFYHRNKPKELPVKYASLKEIKDKFRMNVFVVVSSIIKQPVVLFNKTKHIMLGLVDSSCSEASSSTSASNTYQDIPLHIFLNDTQDSQDEKIVRELRQWWLKKKEKENICVVDPVLLEKKIFEVTSPCTITLNCLINGVRVVEAHNVVILRVTDGTKSSVMTTTVNFNDATMELSSQSEQIDTALLDSEEIDITVFEPLIERASSLKQGDMVQLIRVTCVDVVEGLEALGKPVLDFYMRDEKCEIRKVLQHTSIERELLRKGIA
ncbi:hypothetical protein Anas_02615 [Armadillidium nasatum]|uniref:Uncharacterized protein n=1 Tax=Armadillidium nasatum TaxID=96803 RepID=A0A5N5TJC0_9CRUS|nr:hypothetical protein Anas_02615 [Armadillidium nasatum]